MKIGGSGGFTACLKFYLAFILGDDYCLFFFLVCARRSRYFIIIFDIYWFFKTVYLSLHLRSDIKMKNNLKVDWMEKLQKSQIGGIFTILLFCPCIKRDRDSRADH